MNDRFLEKYEQEFRIVAIQMTNLKEILRYVKRQFGIDDYEKFITQVHLEISKDLKTLLK